MDDEAAIGVIISQTVTVCKAKIGRPAVNQIRAQGGWITTGRQSVSNMAVCLSICGCVVGRFTHNKDAT